MGHKTWKNLLFSFELCLGWWAMVWGLTGALKLAIFFWIMLPVKRNIEFIEELLDLLFSFELCKLGLEPTQAAETQANLLFSFESCLRNFLYYLYFLLNCHLLFSFELCQQHNSPKETVYTKTLAIFFWIMLCRNVDGCPASRWQTILAIFFWIMPA